MRKILLAIPVFIIVTLLAGCQSPVTVTHVPEVQLPTVEVVVPTITPESTKDLPVNTPVVEEYVPFKATVTLDALRLRRNPGYLFETIDLYDQGTQVTVWGRAPGNMWIYVQAGNDLYGWMRIDGLKLDGLLSNVPTVEPGNIIVVRGHVYSTNGSPASDITVMVNPEGSTDTLKQDVAVTNILGQWYIFLPPESEGDWTFVTNGYGCFSTAVNYACNLIGNFPQPQTLALPQALGTWLDFKLIPY